MSKFNKGPVPPVSPITTERIASGQTHEGAPGYERDEKSELFLLAVSNMVSENTFYEDGKSRDVRFEGLVHRVAVADPAWMAAFLEWLRSEANMRSASMVGALEAARAMVAAKVPGSRAIVASVLQRADEPGEALAYWIGQYGRKIPKPIKRGVADAAARLYSEYSLLKYDTASHGFRFGDVIDLTHPSPKGTWQGDLFTYALDRRHQRDKYKLGRLDMVKMNAQLREQVARGKWQALLDPDALSRAGMTWEDALSLVGSKVDKAKLWEALIPSMGYMALLRNLRNFDEAGVSDEVANYVQRRLIDPAAVAKSRQFPFRFLSAYENAPSLRWGYALERALDLSLGNIPSLPGRSLILVDTSASMNSAISAKSKVSAAKAAAVFGVALAAKNASVDLYGFATGVFLHKVAKRGSVIREIDQFNGRIGEVGHGTEIMASLAATYQGHDRVFIISDMQTMVDGYGRSVDRIVGKNTPVYGFNLGGYKYGAYATGSRNRHEFGGLTDATFRMIPLLESGRDGAWPWIN